MIKNRETIKNGINNLNDLNINGTSDLALGLKEVRDDFLIMKLYHNKVNNQIDWFGTNNTHYILITTSGNITNDTLNEVNYYNLFLIVYFPSYHKLNRAVQKFGLLDHLMQTKYNYT